MKGIVTCAAVVLSVTVGYGAEPVVSARADFAAFMKKDIAIWSNVVDYAGVKIK